MTTLCHVHVYLQLLVQLEVALSPISQSSIHAVSCTSCENHSFITSGGFICSLSLSLSVANVFPIVLCVCTYCKLYYVHP